MLEDGLSPRELATRPLWPDGVPKWAQDNWPKLKSGLVAPVSKQITAENWQVWIDWYEARLEGRDPWPEEVEVACALIADDIWQQGPKAANSEIKRIRDEWAAKQKVPEPEAEHVKPPTIPALVPAAIEPILHNNRLVLPQAPAQGDLKGPSLASLLRSLKEQIDWLAANYEKSAPNPDARVVSWLNELSQSVPKTRPKQNELFKFGHELKTVQRYLSKVNDEWPEILAAKFAAMALTYERTLKQFPKWREFVRNAENTKIDREDLEQIGHAAEALNQQLRSEDAAANVDPEIPDTLERLRNKLKAVRNFLESPDPLDAAKQELAADVLESISNIYKRLSESAIADVVREYGTGLKRGAKKEARTQGEKDGKSAVKWTRRILLLSLAGGVGKLAGISPEKFGWLLDVIRFLGKAGGG